MTICVKYFASFRETVGHDEETMEVAGMRRVKDVWRKVRALHDLPEDALCAVNQKHADEQTAIRDGDEVAFFPQITGG